MNYTTREELGAHNLHAAENRARRQVLPIIGPCKCCNKGNVRCLPTGALECDNPYCSIMGASLNEFNPDRKARMRVDVLQLIRDEIDRIHKPR